MDQSVYQAIRAGMGEGVSFLPMNLTPDRLDLVRTLGWPVKPVRLGLSKGKARM